MVPSLRVVGGDRVMCMKAPSPAAAVVSKYQLRNCKGLGDGDRRKLDGLLLGGQGEHLL